MIRPLFFFLFLTFSFIGYGQNLVPNSSFEGFDFTSRFLNKTGRDFERQAINWTVPNQASTDLISPRFKSTNLTVIPPHSGKHMAGIVTNGSFWAEYVGIKLRQKLVPGTQYYVEFWISMPAYYSKKRPVATFLGSHFGVLFSNKIFHRSKEIVKGKPQVNAGKETFVEPTKWTKVFGTFTATEATQYLYLGQFDDGSSSELNIGYFFIDDVFVQAFESTAVKYEPSRYYNITGSVASVIMDNIYFETDKHDLLPESNNELNKLAGIMQKNPSLTIQIQGHTDSQGDEAHNADLSKNRAKTVHDYLVGAGINEKRLSSKGFGDSKPVAENSDETGRKRNRRVEFVINGNITADELSQGPGDVYRISEFIRPDEWLSKTFTQPFAYRNICTDEAVEKSGDANALTKCKPIPAADYLLKQTVDKKAVFFNEFAPNPQNRAFTTSLLKDLYEQGFRYLAIEALSPKETKLAKRGYPVLNSGRLIREPLFGDMVRQALKLGFTLYPFEPTPTELDKAKRVVQKSVGGNLNKEQLNNISRKWAKALNISRIYQRNPEAKVLVYCSKSNLREDLEGAQQNISGWLKKLSSVNPYTIDQATLTEKCPEITHPLFNKRAIKEPTVWLNKDKAFNTYSPTALDLQIQHPKASTAYGRPNWLSMNGYRKPFAFNPDKHGMTYPCLVMAYKKGEDTDFAVPVDALEFPTNADRLSLMLPKGKYQLILSDETKFKALNVEIE
ncbi:MAG: outer membrane protein OmpA-like peptidoglycan-associated protein [Polaribacter sp.]|jgi:outer membrane protein OmpA-like peptidoglycan-associated protein